jgi:hypothetical protein
MWWIKAKAKQIVVIILVLGAVGGGAFWYQNRSDGQPGTDGGTGVRVFQNDEGQIVVSNSNAVNPKLTFALPRNCDEALQLMKDVQKSAKRAVDSTPENRQVFALYDALARELCSYTVYLKSSTDFITDWYVNPDAPTTTTGSSTTVEPNTNTPTGSSTTTTTQGE